MSGGMLPDGIVTGALRLDYPLRSEYHRGVESAETTRRTFDRIDTRRRKMKIQNKRSLGRPQKLISVAPRVSGRIQLLAVKDGGEFPVPGFPANNLVVNQSSEVLASLMANTGYQITHIGFEFSENSFTSLDPAEVEDGYSIVENPKSGRDTLLVPILGQAITERVSDEASSVTFSSSTDAGGDSGINGKPWVDPLYISYLSLVATVPGIEGRRPMLFSRAAVGASSVAKPEGFELVAHWEIMFDNEAAAAAIPDIN